MVVLSNFSRSRDPVGTIMHSNCYTGPALHIDAGAVGSTWHQTSTVDDSEARTSLASLFNDLSKNRASATTATATDPHIDVSLISASSAGDYIVPHRFMSSSNVLHRSDDIVGFFGQHRRDLNHDDVEDDHGSLGHDSDHGSHVIVPTFQYNGGISVSQSPHISGFAGYPAKLSMMPLLGHVGNDNVVSINNNEIRDNAVGVNVESANIQDGDRDDNDNEDEDDEGSYNEEDDDDVEYHGNGANMKQPCQTMQRYPTPTSMLFPQQASDNVNAGAIACQDCGNQAKKDCVHKRCRTCCKGQGLECPTHIKSTWVPASSRRHKKHYFASMGGNSSVMRSYQGNSSVRTDGLNPEQVDNMDATVVATNSFTSTSTGTPPTNSDVNWIPQECRSKRLLPMEATEHATFKCVKVSGINDGLEEFAYQTVVKIGGHLYKGMLYDQGLDAGHHEPGVAEFQLGGKSATPLTASVDLAGHLYGTSESVFTEGNYCTS